MQPPDFSIRTAEKADLEALNSLKEQIGGEREPDYFERNFELQSCEKREILIASRKEGVLGFCILSWQPRYALFKKLQLPEIQDLNVISDARKRGVGTALIKECEARAIRVGKEEMGISVGLHASFGSAQRLYVALGYVPDGNGVSYDRDPVQPGDMRPVDDDLCLMMIKTLK